MLFKRENPNDALLLNAVCGAVATELVMPGLQLLTFNPDGFSWAEMAAITGPYSLAFGCTTALAAWSKQKGYYSPTLPIFTSVLASMALTAPVESSLREYYRQKHEMTKPAKAPTTQISPQQASKTAYLTLNNGQMSYRTADVKPSTVQMV